MGMILNPYRFGGGLTATFIAQTTNATNQGTPYTFAAHNIGTAAADRMVVVVAHVRDSGGGTNSITGVTVGGNAATQIIQITDVNNEAPNIGIWAIMVAAGATADIVVTPASNCFGAGIAVFTITGRATVTASDTGSAAGAASTAAISDIIDVPVNGCAIAAAVSNDTSTAFGWTGLTERSDAQYDANPVLSTASDNFSGGSTGLTISADPVGTATQYNLVMAAWGP